MRIYLSGPISLGGKLSPLAMAQRIEVFSREAKRLSALGHDVSNPCDVPPQASWEAYMRIDLPMVCEADIVAMLPDWYLSRGSALEVFVATQLGMQVRPASEIVS